MLPLGLPLIGPPSRRPLIQPHRRGRVPKRNDTTRHLVDYTLAALNMLEAQEEPGVEVAEHLADRSQVVGVGRELL